MDAVGINLLWFLCFSIWWNLVRCKLSSGSCNLRVTCPKSLTVDWIKTTPYILEEKDVVKGILPELLHHMLHQCCGPPSCWELKYYSLGNNHSVSFLDATNRSDMMLPVFLNTHDPAELERLQMVPLVNSPTVVFFVPITDNESLGMKVFTAVVGKWPILVMALVLSLISGIVVWILDSWRNPDEFPRAFVKGTWEGFWWAFVTMTTVGYGDRSPRSFLARGFAVLWIMVGICICSIFTATLTTALTTITMESNKVSMRGAKIAALQHSAGYIAGGLQNAHMQTYQTTEEVFEAVLNHDVAGALIDFNIATYMAMFDERVNKDLKGQERVELPEHAWGVSVRDKELSGCLKTVHEIDEGLMYAIIQRVVNGYLREGDDEVADSTESIFDPSGGLFVPTLQICCVVILVMSCIGILWEYGKRRGRLCRRSVKPQGTEKIVMGCNIEDGEAGIKREEIAQNNDNNLIVQDL